jgi:hypothetical protein
MDLGDGPVAGVLAALIVVLVAYLAVTKKDVQREPAEAARGRQPTETGQNDSALPATSPQW